MKNKRYTYLAMFLTLVPSLVFAQARGTRIPDLNELTTMTTDDIIIAVDTPGDPNIYATYKISYGNIFKAYFADSTETDQGLAGNGQTIKNHVDTISTNKGTIVLKHISGASTEYTLNTNETIPSNITLEIEPGAYIDGNATLTIDGPFSVGRPDAFQSSNVSISTLSEDLVLIDANWSVTDLELPSQLQMIGSGYGSILKQNSLAGDFVIGNTGSVEDELVIDSLVINGNTDLGVFTGSGHGLKLDQYNKIFIDNLEIKNCAGHGLVLQTNVQKMMIGKLYIHHNDKYGVSIASNLSDASVSTELIIDQILAHDNTWTGVSLGDNYSNLARGFQNVIINSIITRDNTGSGLTLGTNATGGNLGAVRTQIGQVQAYNNSGHGVEIFGASETQIGSILSYGNTNNGVVFGCGDDTNTPTQSCQVGNIISHSNYKNGVHIAWVDKLSIDAIEVYNNDANNTDTYYGLSFHPGMADQNIRNEDIYIGSVIAYDDQGTKTQTNGINFLGTDSRGPIVLGNVNSSGNKTYDLSGTTAYCPIIKELNCDVIYPSYAQNVDGAGVGLSPFRIEDCYWGRAQTTDGSTYTLMRVPVDDSTRVIMQATITAEDPNNFTTTFGTYEIVASAYNDTNTTALNGAVTSLHSVETHGGLDGTFTAGGAGTDYMNVRVTGLAATTLNWEARVRIVDDKKFGN